MTDELSKQEKQNINKTFNKKEDPARSAAETGTTSGTARHCGTDWTAQASVITLTINHSMPSAVPPDLPPEAKD